MNGVKKYAYLLNRLQISFLLHVKTKRENLSQKYHGLRKWGGGAKPQWVLCIPAFRYYIHPWCRKICMGQVPSMSGEKFVLNGCRLVWAWVWRGEKGI